MPTDAQQVQYPEGMSQQIIEKYGPEIARLAAEIGVYKFHHIGLEVDEKHPQATYVPSTKCWVSPVENGVETLCFEQNKHNNDWSRPHFCFAIDAIEPFIQRGYPVTSQVNGPLGPATFTKVAGETVELLIPIS